MSKIWGIPSTYKLGAQNQLFGRLRNLTVTLTAYILGMKHDIDNWASVLTTTRGLLYIIQTDSNWTALHTFYFIPRLRRRRSANETRPNCQTVDDKSH